MLAEEWGLQLDPPSPWRAGLATLAAFVLAGMIPLVPTMVWMGKQADETFLASSVLTGITFFAIGFVRGRVVDRRPSTAGIETLVVGGSAALLAYLVGRLLERLAA